MPAPRTSMLRRAEGRLWTGPAAHLLGGGADLAGAIVRHLLARVRSRVSR